MKRLISIIVVICIFSGFVCLAAGDTTGATGGFSVAYRLYMEKEDFARVEISVSGYTGAKINLYFQEGGVLGSVGDLTEIFINQASKDENGTALQWGWTGDKSLSVDSNGKNFTFSYEIDALKLARGELVGGINQLLGHEAFVLFRNDAVYFTPDVLFMLPDKEPDTITLQTFFPEGTDLYATLPVENGKYVVKEALWGDLRNDFCNNFFVGGKTILHIGSTGTTGNTYDFTLFDWRDRAFYEPWYKAGLENAGKTYGAVTDMFAQFFSDQIGPLDPHAYVIADNIPTGTEKGFPSVNMRNSWFNYMQLWPDSSAVPQVAHHMLHAYLFFGWGAKIQFNVNSFLYEGVTTYIEDTTPGLLLGDDYFTGRLYALLMLDQRGENYGIGENQFHTRYNIPALKVYLLDEAIKEESNGKSNILDFIRVLWQDAKDDKKPQSITEEQTETALIEIAGTDIVPIYRQIKDAKALTMSDFTSLKPSFDSYVQKMADDYFWGSELLFLCYMDVCSIKGDYWPHYSLIEHNIVNDRRDAMKPFQDYLKSLNKKTFTQNDILNALSRATGKDHSGFFEYWNSMGFELSPADLPALGTWNADTQAPYTTKTIPSMSTLNEYQDLKVVLNNEPLEFDVDPIAQDGRTLVPIRKIVEALGGTVDWKPDGSIVMTIDATTIRMNIGEKTAYVNDQEYTLDVPAFAVSGRTMVPLRFLSEAVGCNVDWYGLVRTIVIEK